MSSLSRSAHIEFLSGYFNLPDPNRTTPFIPAGVTGATSFFDGLPDASLVDRKFTQSKEIEAARFSIIDAFLDRGASAGWLNIYKKPVDKMENCGHKQGFCTKENRDFIVNKYRSSRYSAAVFCANHIGFHTNISSPFVIDLDFKEGEKDATQTFFAFLEKNSIDPRQLPCVMTPSGGLHLYFLPYDGEHKNSVNFASKVWGPGVDIRGTGGLALAAGSFVYDDGVFKQYTVLNNAPLQPLHECIVDVFEHELKKNAQANHATNNTNWCEFASSSSELNAACRIVASRQEGQRNDTLNKISYAIGKLVRDGKVSEEEAGDKLLQAALHTGLGEGEASTTIRSGLSAGSASTAPYEPFEPINNDAQAPATTEKEDPEDEEEDVTKLDDEAFLRAKEIADLSYTPGLLKLFAERRGRLTDERIDEIAKFVLPQKIYNCVKSIQKVLKFDLAPLVQAAVVTACQSVKGARKVDTIVKNGIPANLFLLVVGAPTAGKSLLGNTFLGHIAKKQVEEWEKFKAEYEQYIEALKERQSKKGKSEDDGGLPAKPIYKCFYSTDATMEALLVRAQDNPAGILMHLDEGAGQANLGADRYNSRGTADVRAKLIEGYQSLPTIIDRKNNDGNFNTIAVNPFNLCIWTNVQDNKVKETFSKKDEDQGYLQRFLFIMLSSKSSKKTSIVSAYSKREKADLEFMNKCIDKLLALAPVSDGSSCYIPKLQLTDEVIEVFQKWEETINEKYYKTCVETYITRFIEHVLKFALGLHYLHLAAYCEENATISEEYGTHALEIIFEEVKDNEFRGKLEKIDIERAIAVSDIFLKSLDEFLWMLNKPEHTEKKRLTLEEETLAKHVIANKRFYDEPRSVTEIINCGLATNRTPKSLCAWLKKSGFEVANSGGRRHREVKFLLNGLAPWREAVDLSRLAFTENRSVPVAKTLIDCKQIIEASDYKMSVAEFAENLGAGADVMIKDLINERRFMVDEYDKTLLFRKETFDVATQVLNEEGLIIDGKMVA